MNRKIYKNLILIVTIFTILFVSNFVFSIGSDLPITQLAVSQTKQAGIAVNKMTIGNLDNPVTLARLTSGGWLGLGLPLSGSLTNPQVSLDVRGIVRLSELTQPSRKVCANKDGDISDCGFQEFTYGENCFGSCNTARTKHKFTVPAGVTSITVELWGAGGAGYGVDTPNTYNKSPDDSSNNCFNYPLNCGAGGSSYLYDTDGNTILARAYGGQAPNSTSAGGTGGGTSVPGSSLTILSVGNGESGGVGGSGGTAMNTYLVCNTNTFTIRNGKNGGAGGTGGSSGSAGASILGPRGGFPGTPINCEISTPPNDGIPFKGVDGFDAIRGSGGSGASGHGGSEYNDLYGSSCASYPCLNAQNGYSGGGGGGYVKVQFNVNPRNTYTIELSQGGHTNYVPPVSGLACDFRVKWTCFQDTKSGDGGPGFARISW